MQTGRISSLNGGEKDFDRVVENVKQQSNSFTKESLKGINMEQTPLSMLFFSDVNLNALQTGIKNLVFKRSNGKHNIGNQSPDELKIIMRAMFFQHAKHLPFDIVEQVKEINTYVLEYAVKTILSELDMYEKYLHDIQNHPEPMAAGINTSVKGSKVIELKSFF